MNDFTLAFARVAQVCTLILTVSLFLLGALLLCCPDVLIAALRLSLAALSLATAALLSLRLILCLLK